MFGTVSEFIDFISSRKSTGNNSAAFSELLSVLGNPERKLQCLHIAGTNGKGSTADYLRSILQAHGYKVGFFTSPHLTVHNDRIRINNENIPDDILLFYGNRFAEYYDRYSLTMFQIDMLISVYYFLDSNVDYAVYETGLGGRFDATNVITPLASIITNIGFDHMAILGNTLPEIACEKAGIIKENTPVFTAEPKKCCLDVFRETAEMKHSELFTVRAPKGRIIEKGVSFSYHGYDVTLPTMALYQTRNAALAIRVADHLRTSSIIDLSRADIIRGLETTSWPGRFEIVSNDPLIIVDGAHNTHGIKAAEESIRHLSRPLCIIASVLSDKQYGKIINKLQQLADELIVTTFTNDRATPLDKLAEHRRVTVISDYRKALEYATERYADGTIYVTGSLYFVSEIRSLFKGE